MSEIMEILHGENICTLLLPDKPIPRNDGSFDRSWCATYAGWLHPTKVEFFRKKLLDSQTSFMKIAQNPQKSLHKELNPQGKKFIVEGKLYSEWISEGLMEVYQYFMLVFNTACEKKKSLSLAVSV